MADGAVENFADIATFTGRSVIIEVLVDLASGNIALTRLDAWPVFETFAGMKEQQKLLRQKPSFGSSI